MSDLLLAKLFYFISWFHIKLSHTPIFRCQFISFEIYAKVGVVDSFFPIIITLALPMSFCTNSVALPLSYQVNGSNKVIIVFLVFVSVLASIHSSDKKMPLHIKKNISVTQRCLNHTYRSCTWVGLTYQFQEPNHYVRLSLLRVNLTIEEKRISVTV